MKKKFLENLQVTADYSTYTRVYCIMYCALMTGVA